MKIPAALFLIVGGAFATIDDNEGILKSATPSLASLEKHRYRHLATAGQLEASKECLANMDALYSTSDVLSANEAWVNEMKAYKGECIQNSMSLTCTFDSKTLASHDVFVNACTEAGGTPALFSDSFSCTVSENGSTALPMFVFVDVPECIATSCDESVGRALVASFVEDTTVNTESTLLNDFDSVQCISEPESSASPLKASFSVMSLIALLYGIL